MLVSSLSAFCVMFNALLWVMMVKQWCNAEHLYILICIADTFLLMNMKPNTAGFDSIYCCKQQSRRPSHKSLDKKNVFLLFERFNILFRKI